MKKHAALLVNCASRKGRHSFREAQQLLEAKGFDISVYPIFKPKRLTEQMRKLVKQGEKLIIVGGGDGTISTLVGYAAYTDIVLGFLPLGTANSFSRSLDIPGDLAGAVDIIAAGKTAQIDLGKINDDYFANAASIGFASTIANEIPHSLKKYAGVLSYAIQGLRSIRLLKPFKVVIEEAGEETKLETYQVVIANGGFYGPTPLVSKKRLQSADLTIFPFKDIKPSHLFRMWLDSLAGKKFAAQDMDRIRIRDEITLTATPRQRVSVDGEIRMKTPIRIIVAPKAITVFVAGESRLHK